VGGCVSGPSANRTGGGGLGEPGGSPSEKQTQRVLHMIGNAHIDPVWLWQWPEGYQEVRATFQSAVERMDEYPEFVFTCDSVVYLQWVEESDPELFARIRERIAEGRFQVIGGWWVEPDCNIPSGESYVRQALYGQRYLHDRFGITSSTGSNVDPFGHNAMLPQILHKSGLDSYVFQRPGPKELALPGQYFWWQSADGSQVLAYRIPHEYCSPRGDIDEHVQKVLAELPADGPQLMVFYGVGNHGGGPTRANIESIRRLNETGGTSRLEFSSPRAFFDSVVKDDNIPVHTGEMLHHAVGCYSAHSGVKRWNRRTENVLQRAEKWAVVADVLGGARYPLEDLTDAWKLVLFNQFHDTLAGTSIAPAYEDSRDQYGHACSLAANAFNRAVQTISRRIDIPAEPELRPLVVFNPHPWRLQTDVEFEYTWLPADGARMTDDDGAPVPVQSIRPHTTMSSSRGRLVFPADVPPLGYRVYKVYPGADQLVPLNATETTLENEFIALEIDPATGWLSRLDDKRTGVDLAARGPHAVVVDDHSDTWGHGVLKFDRIAGEFDCTSVRLVEHGPVRAVIRVESGFGDSTLIEDVVLGANARFVEVRSTLDWREKLRILKIRVPTSVQTDRATFEVPYGHLEREANGDEQPAQAWVDVSGPHDGLSVVNDSKYGHDVQGGDIGITVARSAVYAWHHPRVLDEPTGRYEYLDQGGQDFTYRLVPHAGDWRVAGAVRLAAELNQPAFTLIESYHAGELPARASFMSDGDGDVVATVLKAAEDDDALVVRAYESSGRPARAMIELPLVGRTIEAEFGPAEIKTFRVPRDPASPIRETNLLEW
jgi:alpha-mannosidase